MPKQTSFQSLSSTAIRYAKRLHTSDKRAKEAISATAVRARISIISSDGIDAIGQGAEGEPNSISGLVGTMEKEENEAMRSGIVPVKRTDGGGAGWYLLSGDEWRAGLGTVGEALEGLTMTGFEWLPTDDGGKCLFL